MQPGSIMSGWTRVLPRSVTASSVSSRVGGDQGFGQRDPLGVQFAEVVWSFASRPATPKGASPWATGRRRLGLLIYEEEVPWVRQIFQWYLEGVSALVIGQRLNEAQVPLKTAQRPRPDPWTKDLVLRILRNRLYLGELSCQGEFVVAEHPALIDRETFGRVQALLEPKARDGHARRARNPHLPGPWNPSLRALRVHHDHRQHLPGRSAVSLLPL